MKISFFSRKLDVNQFSLLMAFACMLVCICLVLTTLFFENGVIYSALFDDGMISYRYAQNIANGIGPYWNQGDKVEGFTNPLWTYLIAFFYFISNHNLYLTPLFIQFFGSLLLSSSVFIAAKLALSNGLGLYKYYTWPSVLTSISPIIFYPCIYWSVYGMENSLIILVNFLIFVISYSGFFKLDRITSKYECFFLFFLAFLAQLTRPDSFVILIPIAFLSYCYNSNRSQSLFNHLYLKPLSVCTGLLLAFCFVSIWRRLYFNSDVPNTYTLKVLGIPFADQVYSGAVYLLPLIVALIPIAVIYYLVVQQNSKNFVLSKHFLIILFLVSIYQIRIGGDPWPYWRVLSSPIQIFLFIFLYELQQTKKFRMPFALNVHIFVIIAIIVLNFQFIIKDGFGIFRYLLGDFSSGIYQVTANKKNIVTALRIKQNFPSNSKIAVVWAGVIPAYLPNHYAVDILGKSEGYIASLSSKPNISWLGMKTVPGHNKYDLKYVLDKYQPDYMQIAKWGIDDLTTNQRFSNYYQYCDYFSGYIKKSTVSCPADN